MIRADFAVLISIRTDHVLQAVTSDELAILVFLAFTAGTESFFRSFDAVAENGSLDELEVEGEVCFVYVVCDCDWVFLA